MSEVLSRSLSKRLGQPFVVFNAGPGFRYSANRWKVRTYHAIRDDNSLQDHFALDVGHPSCANHPPTSLRVHFKPADHVGQARHPSDALSACRIYCILPSRKQPGNTMILMLSTTQNSFSFAPTSYRPYHEILSSQRFLR
jgi:hypothetical protein